MKPARKPPTKRPCPEVDIPHSSAKKPLHQVTKLPTSIQKSGVKGHPCLHIDEPQPATFVSPTRTGNIQVCTSEHDNSMPLQNFSCDTERKTPISTQTIGIQACVYEDIIKDHAYSHTGNPPGVTVPTQTDIPPFTIWNLKSNGDYKFYTGLPQETFHGILTVLEPVIEVPFTMEFSSQLLLVLMRLRLGLLFADLGHRFGISRQQAGTIFNTWIEQLATLLGEAVMWLPRSRIQATLPKGFKDMYPNTTCILDCTEIFIERPARIKTRAQTYSTYKGHNTLKYLIAIAPCGYIMFVSDGYGGRASDNHVTKTCGLLNFLRPGDEVMADRGFTIGEQLFARQVKLNIPPFLKKRAQMTEKEVTETRRVASVRIHVERAIRRMKSWSILQRTITITTVKQMDNIITVCAALSNLRGKLIKEELE